MKNDKPRVGHSYSPNRTNYMLVHFKASVQSAAVGKNVMSTTPELVIGGVTAVITWETP